MKSKDFVINIVDPTKRKLIETYRLEKTEVDFMKEILMPLFDRMGFKKVVFNHGSGELGKDFILVEENKLGNEEIICVVVKNGNINNSGPEKKKLAEVKNQIEQSLTVPLKEPGYADLLPNKVYVVCSGTISQNVKDEITSSRAGLLTNNNIRFLSQDDLVPLIEKFYPQLFVQKMPFVASYLESLKNSLKKEALQDSSLSKVLGKISLFCYREVESPKEKGKTENETRDVLALPYKNNILWLQGGNGSGKTYSVHKIAEKSFSIVRDKDSSQDVIVPFYIKASSFLPGKEVGFIPLLLESANKFYPHVREEDVRDWGARHCILLVIDEYEKNQSSNAVDALINSYRSEFGKEPSILLLSRIVGEFGNTFSVKATVWNLKTLELKEAVSVLKDTVKLGGERAEHQLDDFMRNGILERIPKTPLAINILSHLFSEKMESSPNNLYEFFDMFFQLVLGKWRRGRDSNKAYDYNQVRAFYQMIAYQIVKERDTRLSFSSTIGIARQVLDGISESSLTAEEYAESLCTDSEIVFIDGGYIEFTHLTYLEFLAGCELSSHYWDPTFVVKHLADSAWEECLIFAAGAKKRDDKVLELICSFSAESLEGRFLYLKNTSYLLQALYQSAIPAKTKALEKSLCDVISIRDDERFHDLLSTKFEKVTELHYSGVALGLYSRFYGRQNLVNALLEHLSKNPTGRSRHYLIAALTTSRLQEKQVKALLSYVQSASFSDSEPEAVAVQVFLRRLSKKTGDESEIPKQLMGLKKIRKLGKKVMGALRDEGREFIRGKTKVRK